MTKLSSKPQVFTAQQLAKREAKKGLPRLRLSRADILRIYQHLERLDPEPQTELEYTNPFTLVVAVALSAQATDIGVNKATKDLFKVADTPQKMVDLGEEALKTYIKTIGLFNTKAKNVILLSKRLIEVYGGEVPEDRDALITLPGVGRKTANVVMNVIFGHETMAVDTHIFRVGNRTGMAPGKDPTQVELNLYKGMPEGYGLHAHHWLILHGRYTCIARKPKCYNCAISEICKFKDKTPAAK